MELQAGRRQWGPWEEQRVGGAAPGGRQATAEASGRVRKGAVQAAEVPQSRSIAISTASIGCVPCSSCLCLGPSQAENRSCRRAPPPASTWRRGKAALRKARRAATAPRLCSAVFTSGRARPQLRCGRPLAPKTVGCITTRSQKQTRSSWRLRRAARLGPLSAQLEFRAVGNRKQVDPS